MRNFPDLEQEPELACDDSFLEEDVDPLFVLQISVGMEKIPTDLCVIGKILQKTRLPLISYEVSDGYLALHFLGTTVTVSPYQAISKEEFDSASCPKPPSPALLSSFEKQTASLVIEASGIERKDVDLGFLASNVAVAVASLSEALLVCTPTLIFETKEFIDIVTRKAQNRLFPFDVFVSIGMTTDKCGTSFLQTHGMWIFHEGELTSEKDPDEDWTRDLRKMAYELLFRDSLSTEESHCLFQPRFIMRGYSGYSYTLRPGRWLSGNSLQSWQARRTGYFWMDDPYQIQNNLVDTGVWHGHNDLQLMNRMAAFLSWAESRDFLTPRFENQMQRQMGSGDYRGEFRSYLLDYAGSLDSRIFKKQVRPFVENYYNQRYPLRGYFRDAREIALDIERNPVIAAKLQAAGIEAPALLPWSRNLYEAIEKRLDERYAEYENQ